VPPTPTPRPIIIQPTAPPAPVQPTPVPVQPTAVPAQPTAVPPAGPIESGG
jgi:hypothetical protein